KMTNHRTAMETIFAQARRQSGRDAWRAGLRESRFARYKGAVQRVVPLAVLVLIVAACGSTKHRAADAAATKPTCPAAWRPGWQKLANRAQAPVYCPSWMPVQ